MEKIFITGGAGYLGRHLVEHYYNDNEITVFSRDEAKHVYLKKKFPKINCIIGDIRNFDLLKRASKDHTIGIFPASIKHIESVDQNVEEGVSILVNGAINSRRISEENEFKAACFISSDKSRAATTLYGAMKFIAGESFIVDAEQSNVKLSTAIYGNVLNSTGSIIPLIWDSIKNKYSLTLYSEQMTRYMIDIQQAVTLVTLALKTTGHNVIPNLQAFRVKDLFEIYADKFGLKYTLGKPRISEKLHEMMCGSEEVSRTYYNSEEDTFYMHYKDIAKSPIKNEMTSDKVTVSKEDLLKCLENYDYFK
jgi:UDP-glucose 4-epimerase